MLIANGPRPSRVSGHAVRGRGRLRGVTEECHNVPCVAAALTVFLGTMTGVQQSLSWVTGWTSHLTQTALAQFPLVFTLSKIQGETCMNFLYLTTTNSIVTVTDECLSKEINIYYQLCLILSHTAEVKGKEVQFSMEYGRNRKWVTES